MKNKKQSGGARANAGRKPNADPTIQITIRVPSSVMLYHGGYMLAKIKAQNFLISTK